MRSKVRPWGIFLVALVAGLILTTGLLNFIPPQASAVSSSTINFQARLLSISGNIVPDGNYHVEFKLYTASAPDGGETPIQGSCTTNPGAAADEDCEWVETRTTGNLVRVVNGYLTVNLGSVTAFASTINWDQEHWLTMNIGGTSGPSWDGEMSPRVKLTALPYAFRAGKLALTSGTDIGTLSFGSVTNDPVLTLPNETGTVCSTGSVCSGYQAAGSYANVGLSNLSGVAINTSLLPGSDNSIDLGNATTASWRSSYFDTSVLTPLIDTISAGTLNLGTTTATAISLNQNTTVAAAKTFTVTSGATSLTGATSGDALTVSNSTSTGNVSVFKDNTTAVATIADGGATTFQNSVNSTAAFQIQNSAGTSLFTADTTNQLITTKDLQLSTGNLTLANNGASASLRAQLATSTVTASGNEITDVTRSTDKNTGGQGDGRAAPDSSYGIWEGTTNLVTNGGFETNTTGWAAHGTGEIISRVTSEAKFGSAALKMVTDGSTNSEGSKTTGISITGGQTYTFSTWIKAPSGATFELQLEEGGGASGLSRQSATGTGAWQRVSVTRAMAGAATTASLYITTVTTSQAITYYADGVQLELKSIVTPYVETDGGTASRSAGSVTSPSSLTDETQGWFAARVRMGFTTPPPYTYANVAAWGDDTSNDIMLYRTGANWGLERYASGTGNTVTNGTSFNSGDFATVIGYWTSTTIKISVNGSAFTSVGNTNVPTLSSANIELGKSVSYNSAVHELDGDILWTATGTGTLSDADAAAINRYGNSDPNVADLTTTATSSTPTFVWKADNNNYQDTNPSYRAALQLDDTYLYRSGVGALTLQNATNSTTGFAVQNAAGTNLLVVNTTASQLAVGPSGVPANGVLTIGTNTTAATGGLYFGTDANLYRSAANTLKTDDTLVAGSDLQVTTLGSADSATYLCRNAANQVASCNTTGAGAAFIQGGNSFGATATLGTNDSNSLSLETNNVTQATIAVGGAATFQNSVNSTTAFQIQNSAGTNTLINADTTNLLVTIGTDLKIAKRADSGGTTADWTKASFGTGTIKDGGTGSIDYVNTMAVYNGSLYVGTGETDKAEVYRYDGGTAWTRVSFSDVDGRIDDGDTASINEVNAMAVYNGSLYIGTDETNGVEVYRYEGGTNWTKVSDPTKGTIKTGGTPLIRAVQSMAVYNGSLYVGTIKTDSAEIYRYDGGTAWTKVSNATPGTILTTTLINSVYSMAVYNGSLYAGTNEPNATEVYRYDGGTAWTRVNSAAGTLQTTTLIGSVESMAVYNGSLYAGTDETNGAEVYRYDGNTSWTKVSDATAGTIAFSGTASIDEINALAVYNGSLYAGTDEAAGSGDAEVYRYDGGTSWTKVSNATPGTIAASGTADIQGAQSVIAYNGSLYVGTDKANAAEVYAFSAVEGQSYSLKFGAASDAAGSTEQTGYPNDGAISFLAEQQANGNTGNIGTGSFLFSHGITTAFGAYDLAEDYPTRDDSLIPGDLVSIDQSERGLVRKTSTTADPTMLGIYSAKPGLRLSQKDTTIDGARAIPVALAGRVSVNVSTENGPIVPGDYLTASATPGRAMKATTAGPVVGKALSSFDGQTTQTGQVLAFINVSYYIPPSADLLQSTTTVSNLNLIGDTTIAQLTVTGSTHFIGSLTLEGHLIAAADTAGTITIPAGRSQATHVFTIAYQKTPKVVVSPTFDTGEFSWWVAKTEQDFTLYLSTPATANSTFNYLTTQPIP